MADEFDPLEEDVMAQMREVYTETVIDHAFNPRNAGSIPQADGHGSDDGGCGDTLQVWLKVNNDRIVNATFWTDGCGAIVACGSIATELARGKSVSQLMTMTQDEILTALGGLPDDQLHCADRAATTIRKAAADYLKSRREPWQRAYRRERD